MSAPNPDQLATLVTSISEVSREIALLQNQVQADRLARERENDTRARENRRTKILAIAAMALGVIGLLVGTAGVKEALIAHEANDKAVATRNESRRVACESDNKFIMNHNSLVDNIERIILLVNQPNPTRTDEQQATIDKFIRDSITSLESSRVAARDCSPDGIAAYYHDQ